MKRLLPDFYRAPTDHPAFPLEARPAMTDLPHPAESRRLVSRRSLLRNALLLTGGTTLLTACVPPRAPQPDRATVEQGRPGTQATAVPRPAEVEKPAAKIAITRS